MELIIIRNGDILQLLKDFIFGQVKRSVKTFTASTLPNFTASIKGVLPPESNSFFS
jgi:hypothetical protein